MNDAKLWELYKSWDALVKHKEKMGNTILQLIAHPDSTPEHLAETLPRYKELVGKLREHKPTILNALNKGTTWQVSNAYDRVKNTQL